MRRSRGPRLAGLGGVLLAGTALRLGLLGCLPGSGGEGISAFKIQVAEPGIYRVTYEELVAAGLPARRRLDAARLALTQRGEDVPIYVADGGDGRFGRGDHVEFLGEHLPGERSFHNEHTRFNVYRLRLDADGGARMRVPPAPASAVPEDRPDVLTVREHLEPDQLLVRFTNAWSGPKPEPWYWAKLTHVDREPFRLDLDLSEARFDSARPFSLRIHLRGWSYAVRKDHPQLADHRVEVLFNQRLVGSGEWNGQEDHVIDVAALPAGVLQPQENRLSLRVPRRRPAAGADPLIDVVLLNWIELGYPRRNEIGADPARIHLTAADPGRAVRLVTAAGQRLVVYGADGSRIEAEPGGPTPDGRWSYRFQPPREDLLAYVVPAGRLRAPAAVEPDHASHLRNPGRQADYLLITHPTLRQAVEPLVRFHRERGLAVEVVDVDDVFDEFNQGILHPRAIRDFVDYAYHRWRPPAPRFVLLVGDASWDTRNAKADDAHYSDWTYRPGEVRKFGKNTSTPYATASSLGYRNLIPTWHFETYQGPAASDNYFVAVDGHDHLPDLAIGRFPVTEPQEVAAIVEKTLRYATNAKAGPWRRNVLWITNERKSFQRTSDRLSDALVRRGFDSYKVYPAAEEKGNERHQAKLRRAFDEGQLLVHFFGHGGRYIWRTGPPDIHKNHDLFTLDDLDKLAPTARLPVVLSMTCYSAPFDHPTADSIGEKFLRLPARGAVAVFAASWRNNPSPQFSNVLLQELTRPAPPSDAAFGGTVGEAILRAKRHTASRLLVETYNLLGDPAVELALPDELAATLGTHTATSRRP